MKIHCPFGQGINEIKETNVICNIDNGINVINFNMMFMSERNGK